MESIDVLGSVDSWLTLFNWQVLLRLGMAVLLGGMIGVERELRGRPAGLRTMILVCLGATLVMIASDRLPLPFTVGPNRAIVRIDPGRIAAGVVTGIGFLGAGVILRLSDVIRGVTTAATIWFVAALGLVIGQGHYALAIMASATAMIVLWVFSYLERPLHGVVYPTLQLSTAADDAAAVLTTARELVEQRNMRVMDLKVATDVTTGTTELQLFLRATQLFQAHEVVSTVADLEGVRHARWK
jgi:putative Mg2+ transporter-C (MgtC) family protein